MKLDPKLQAQLGELFKTTSEVEDVQPENTSSLRLLTPDEIETTVQPRTQFHEEDLKDLENSIRELSQLGQGISGSGILQPLIVRPVQNGKFLVVAGERRLRAATSAGIKKIPVIVSQDGLSEEDAFEQAIVENLIRSNLGPMEEATALERWMKSRSFSLREAASRLGKGKGYIEDRLRLLKLPPELQQMVSGRPDTLTHAREIAQISDDKIRTNLIRAVLEDGASVAQIRATVAKSLNPSEVSGRPDSSPQTPTTNDLSEILNALKALSKTTKTLENEQKIELANQLEKMAAKLRKDAR